jgi:predicted nuclease with TOPRIM domain
MTEQEFKNKRKELEAEMWSKVHDLQDEIKNVQFEHSLLEDNLRKQYAEKNHKFDIGDRVRRKNRPDMHLIIKGYLTDTIHDINNVQILYKCSFISDVNDISRFELEKDIELVEKNWLKN